MDKNILHYLSTIELKDDGSTSDVEVLRSGILQDRDWKIEMSMLRDYVKNYEGNVYGTEIQVNKEHRRGSEAMGWVKSLFIKGRKLMATVEWTELGQEVISKKIFKFVSAELAMEYPHHKTGDIIKNVLIGLALTNAPALKAQTPLALSEELNSLFTKHNKEKHMFEKYLASMKLREIVSLEDKELLKQMLEELPVEEKTEEVKADVAEVEAKPEEPKVEEKTDEEKATEAKAEADKVETEKKAGEAETLAEKLEVSNEKITSLSEKIERKELGEVVSEKMVLSETNLTGVVAEKQDSIVDFMLSLNEEQRNNFNEIMSAVKTVDLSEIGSTKVETKVEGEDLEEKVVNRTNELMAEDKELNLIDAQKKAMSELDK